MTLQIIRKKNRVPAIRALLFGPALCWKTSTFDCAGDRALWLDFHGSTATLAVRPNCAFDPEKAGQRPALLVDLEDMIGEIANDPQHRRDFDWVILEGLDDIERQYLIPEALRIAGTSTLGENFGKACDALVQVHAKFLAVLEKLWLAGFSVGMTAHEQHVERINADGPSYLVTEASLFYQAGKVGKWDCPSIWRDWCDFVVFLTTEGRKVSKGEKDKIGKARGDVDQHVAYLRPEAWLDSAKARRCEALESPLRIKSPMDLWQTLTGTWQRSFAPGAAELEALRQQVRAFAVDAGMSKSARDAVQRAADKEALTTLHAQFKEWASKNGRTVEKGEG